jgi:hypothetical protein
VTDIDPSRQANRLAAVAIELAERVRDEGPDDNAAWLDERLPNERDRFHLLFVLAAAIPTDRTWTELTAWARQPAKPHAQAERSKLQPCGTSAAAARHRAHNEDLCTACRLHERMRDRRRKAESRRAQGAKVAA